MKILNDSSSDTAADISIVGWQPQLSEPRANCMSQSHRLETIGRLTVGIAHEINTPTQYLDDNMRFLGDAFGELQTLLGRCLEVQQASDGEDGRQRAVECLVTAVQEANLSGLLTEIPKAVADSLEGVQYVARIARSIKEFSHPGGEEKQPTDVNRIVEGVLAITCHEWKYVAEIKTHLNPGLPKVPCAAGALQQVLLNLIVNAADAIRARPGETASPKGTITVSTRPAGSGVEIVVQDTGMGISEDIRDRVFDPFVTNKPAGQGSGQGLAIVREIVVQHHGGRITFESAVGEGTTFIVWLPCAQQTQPSPPVSEEPCYGENPGRR